ncbi:HAAS signaling domain-containing protein [Kineococcus sp. SYSU DK004]|uniref:HAAS signaling domain-containing protein n=1 Tax=Kineococcus sp. SYSU DK004 TaxID=3383125 RepID=UPI003D7D145F
MSTRTAQRYTEKLHVALRLRDVPGERIGQVLAEVEAHVADTGEDPVEAFGPPRRYAREVAAATGTAGSWRLDRRTIAVSALVGVLSFLAVTLLADGAAARTSGGDGLWGLSAGASLALGALVAAVVTVFLAVHSARRADPVRDPRTGRTERVPVWLVPVLFAALFAAVPLVSTLLPPS